MMERRVRLTRRERNLKWFVKVYGTVSKPFLITPYYGTVAYEEVQTFKSGMCGYELLLQGIIQRAEKRWWQIWKR